MSSRLHRQISSRMNPKETDELLSIWKANNRAEWSDEAFEVIRDLLKERGAEIPEQNEPVYEVELQDDGLEEWEAKALDDENQPEFYDTFEVIALKDNINTATKALIVVNTLGGFSTFQWFRYLVGSYFPIRVEFAPMVYIIAFIITVLSIAVSTAIVYFPLKALVHILRILMEMEFRSRKGLHSNSL